MQIWLTSICIAIITLSLLGYNSQTPFNANKVSIETNSAMKVPTMPPPLRKKIFLLGSSMTERSFSLEYQGWGASLSNWYARSADILNRGAGGYNSRWLRKYLPRLLENEKPDISIIFIGNNDAIDENEAQHVPLSEFRSNMIAILEHLYNVKPNMVVLLITTTRVNEGIRLLQKDHRRNKYADVLRSIHRNRQSMSDYCPQNMAVVEMWDPSRYAIVPEDLHDGSHLNAVGNKKLFAAIKETINVHFPHLSPDFIRHKPCKVKRKASNEYENESGLARKQQVQLESDRISLNSSILSIDTVSIPTASTSIASSTSTANHNSNNIAASASSTNTGNSNHHHSSSSGGNNGSGNEEVLCLPMSVNLEKPPPFLLPSDGDENSNRTEALCPVDAPLQWHVPRWRHLI